MVRLKQHQWLPLPLPLRLSIVSIVTFCAAGLGVGALLRNIFDGGYMYKYDQTFHSTREPIVTVAAGNCITATTISTSTSNQNSEYPETTNPNLQIQSTTSSTTSSRAADIRPPSLCYENPYVSSLLEVHTLETISEKANTWLANKTNIRDAMYWKSYGKENNHDKFDAFEVMAPCHYTCVGGACGEDTSKIFCGADTLQLREQDCIVYSIGGANNWDFERAIYKATPCHIHTFDCTGNIRRFHVPSELSDRHTFHHICLAAEYKNATGEELPIRLSEPPPVGEMMTLQMMQERLGHRRLDLLKLDIEGYEWPIFESWPELTDFAKMAQVHLPMQILVEVHYQTQMHELWPQPGVPFKHEMDMVQLQEHLLHMGYAVAVRDDNQKCPHCSEFTLLRYKC